VRATAVVLCKCAASPVRVWCSEQGGGLRLWDKGRGFRELARVGAVFVRFAAKANTAVRRWGSRGGVRRHGRASPVLERVHGGAHAVACQGCNVCAACVRGGALRKRTHDAGAERVQVRASRGLMAVAAASGAVAPCCAHVPGKADVDGRNMQDIE
jgi:hypothetical protein